MVALPTPALAATASMEMAATLWPAPSSSSTASRIASSAYALRGRPGPLRSWPVSLTAVVMAFIVTYESRLDQFHALFLGQTLGRGGDGSGGRALAGQPEQRDDRAQQGDDHAADRGVVHGGEERVVGAVDQCRTGGAGLLGHRVRPGDRLAGRVGSGGRQAVGGAAEVVAVDRGEDRAERGHAERAAQLADGVADRG